MALSRDSLEFSLIRSPTEILTYIQIAYFILRYGELDLPLVGEKWSWPGLRNLDVVFSERYDDYSDFGDAEKPKIAVRYKPLEDLTFRGSYAEGFIAPTLGELFATPM